jgi:hypothetical protein
MGWEDHRRRNDGAGQGTPAGLIDARDASILRSSQSPFECPEVALWGLANSTIRRFVKSFER